MDCCRQQIPDPLAPLPIPTPHSLRLRLVKAPVELVELVANARVNNEVRGGVKIVSLGHNAGMIDRTDLLMQ